VLDYGVSPVDGSVAYVVENQLLLVNADGSDRRVLVEGGIVDVNNPFVNRISSPVFSPRWSDPCLQSPGLELCTPVHGCEQSRDREQIPRRWAAASCSPKSCIFT
jgi:hypothetical protein